MKRDTETLTQFFLSCFLLFFVTRSRASWVTRDERREKKKLLSRNCKKIQGIAFRFVIVTFYAGRKSEDVLENKAKISLVWEEIWKVHFFIEIFKCAFQAVGRSATDENRLTSSNKHLKQLFEFVHMFFSPRQCHLGPLFSPLLSAPGHKTRSNATLKSHENGR